MPQNHDLRNIVCSLISGQTSPETVSTGQWSDLINLAISHGIGPMLFWSLKRAGRDLSAHNVFLPLIKSAHQTAMEFVRFQKSQEQISGALASAHIPALWLKGAALAKTVYPEPALRPMEDLDVLVPYDLRDAALTVVRDAGFDFQPINGFRKCSSGDDFILRLSTHHYDLVGGIGNGVKLELHFRLLSRNNDRLLPLERLAWFWEHTHKLALDDGTICDIPTPEAHFLYLCAHAMFHHGEHEEYLLRYLDLHQLNACYELDWDMIFNQAVSWEWTAAIERALIKTREFFATEIPEMIFQNLAHQRLGLSELPPGPARLVPGQRWKNVRQRLAHLTVPEVLQYGVRSLFPSFSYMRKRYKITADRPVWLFYPYRWFDQSREMVLAVWKYLSRSIK